MSWRAKRPCDGAGRPVLAVLFVMALLVLPHSAAAKCARALAGLDPGVVPASLVLPANARDGALRMTYVGHSSFLIESPEGVRIITDYNGLNGYGLGPDVVTMNNAHPTHFSDHVEEGVAHVLRGWNPAGGAAEHDLTIRDVNIWNVPTNVRSYGGGTRINGNSIFVFEMAELCIAHLGHLHHRLDEERLAALGRIDVLLVPVDGGFTLSQDLMQEVIRKIDAPLVLPMHYFNEYTLARFLSLVEATHEIAIAESPRVVISRETLPLRPKVLVLPGT